MNRVVILRLVSSTVTDRVLARGKKSRDEVGVSEVRVLVEQVEAGGFTVGFAAGLQPEERGWTGCTGWELC